MMFRIINIIPLIFFFSCTEVVEFDLAEADPKLVVEGLITDQAGPHYVRLTKTTSFYSESKPISIPDAEIIITDNLGNKDTLEYSSDGYYLTQTLQGVPGRTYFLEITAGGEQYVSQTTLPAVPKIDSMKVYYFNDTSSFLGQVGYYVTFHFKDPQNQSNYYLWKIYSNGELLNETDDIFISDDQGLQENNQLQIPHSYALGDTARVEMFSLTKEGYDFYYGVQTNLNNDGGFFSSPPANPLSNISNGALGLFQASSVEVQEIVTQ